MAQALSASLVDRVVFFLTENVSFVDKCYNFLLDKETKADDIYLVAFLRVRILNRIPIC